MRIGIIGLICIFGCMVLVRVGQTGADIRSRLPDFEREVAQQRFRLGAHEAVRMVVYEKDQSSFVTSNSFEQVIYDETDKIDHNPDALSGYWPYTGSSTGKTNVGWGSKSVERISGHFYDVWSADP